MVFSIHTFTPVMSSKKKTKRPWDAGVQWNRDTRVSEPLIQLLKNHSDNLIIGENEPYSGKEFYYSLDFHVRDSGLPHCAIEIRQDLVNTPTGIRYWTEILSKSLRNILLTTEF